MGSKISTFSFLFSAEVKRWTLPTFLSLRPSLALFLRPVIYDIYLPLIVATRYRINDLYSLLSETLVMIIIYVTHKTCINYLSRLCAVSVYVLNLRETSMNL